MTTSLKAAFGKIKITPEELAPLQGYDPDTNIADPSNDILDDLYARVMILDDGVTRSIIVNVDCCLTNEEVVKVADPSGRAGFYREFNNTFPSGTREEWAKAAGAKVHHISVNATHTHTAPAHYSEKYTSRIKSLITETLENLVPVNISIGNGESKVSAFRRPTLRADLSVPINQTLRVLFFETEDKEPLGAIVNYAVHPTSLRNPTNRISGDIVGLAVNDVEKQMMESFVCLFLQGFSGDVCPLYGDNGPAVDTYPAVNEGSQLLSNDIIGTTNNKKEIHISALSSNTKDIYLPTRDGFYKDHMKVTLMGIAVGQILILSISGEIFNDYIAKIEGISPYGFNMLSGVSNGYSGYIPTLKAFQDGMGGYEMNTTPYSESVEELFLEEVGSFICSLHNHK